MSRAEIQPELWVPDAAAAIAFYQEALGAVEDPRRVAGAAVAAGATETSPVARG